MTATHRDGIEQMQLGDPIWSRIRAETREAAAALALNGTPALVIGDTVVPGAISLDELVGLIADERAKQG